MVSETVSSPPERMEAVSSVASLVVARSNLEPMSSLASGTCFGWAVPGEENFGEDFSSGNNCSTMRSEAMRSGLISLLLSSEKPGTYWLKRLGYSFFASSCSFFFYC